MLKVHIVVSEDTDIAAELDKIDGLAKKHRIGDAKMIVLTGNVETVLADLKRQDTETADYGIKMAVKKSIKTEDYEISLELRPRKSPKEGRGLLSRLLGR
ncbi:MAG: hypothetical protein ACREM6_07505 [Vulcanimicrobiaceae bacterium]